MILYCRTSQLTVILIYVVRQLKHNYLHIFKKTMTRPECLDDLDYLKLCHEDKLKKLAENAVKRGDIRWENRAYLHGISFNDVFLKPRRYNRYTMNFIRDLLSEGWGSAVEVKTRIYVRDHNGNWYLTPKKRFWASQARMLWTAWKEVMFEALPWGKYDGWCHHVMHQIDSRYENGEFKYNPLTTPVSRRSLRDIYQKTVFAQGKILYDREKGRPGRKPKPPLHKSEQPPTNEPNILVV